MMIQPKENFKSPIFQGEDTEVLIDLQNYPVTEIYQKYNENSFELPVDYDQELRFCPKSNHAFLGKLLPQDFIYNTDNYHTVSSSSQGSVTALNNFYSFVQKNLKHDTGSFIDIGANDTTLLKKFVDYGANLIGIDPHVNSNDNRIFCIKDYLENVDLSKYVKGKKTFLSSHTLEHIYDPRGFMKILSENSTEDDQFFFQFPSLDLLVRDCRFDQIHHQHIHYFSIQSFSQLISEFGFELIDHHFDSDHYGTLMVSFRKTSKNIKIFQYERFYTTEEIMQRYSSFVSNISNSNKMIEYSSEKFYCYGASLMLPILSYYMPQMIKALKIIDQDKSKTGLSYVNFDVEIVEGLDIDLSGADVLVTAVATKLATRKIVNKLSELKAMNILLPMGII
jgi:hypothetical protein